MGGEKGKGGRKRQGSPGKRRRERKRGGELVHMATRWTIPAIYLYPHF